MQHEGPTLSSGAMSPHPEDARPDRNEAAHADQAEQPSAQQEEDGPPTPFDHPLFLPVLLFAGMLWFGYDGFINSDPDMTEHRVFNQVGFALLTVLTAFYGYKGYQEFQQDKRREEEERRSGS
jgi:hypothetical protein